MGLRQALPVQPPSAAEAASVAALLQSKPTPYRIRGPITVGRSCQQGPWELQLAGGGALDEVGHDRQVLFGIGGADPAGIVCGSPEEGKELAQRQLFRHLDT